MGVMFTSLIQTELLEYNNLIKDLDKTVFFPSIVNFKTKFTLEINKYVENCFEINLGEIDLTINSRGLCCIRVSRYWDHFLTDIKTRDQMKEICREFAQYFQTNRILYVPDHYGLDYVFNDVDLGYVIDSLKRRLGNPADSIESIFKEFDEHVEYDGYYIEVL